MAGNQNRGLEHWECRVGMQVVIIKGEYAGRLATIEATERRYPLVRVGGTVLGIDPPNMRAAAADEFADSRGYATTVAKLEAEIAELVALREAARNILPYLVWTISDESPGYHPTMPSAVAAFKAAFSKHQEARP